MIECIKFSPFEKEHLRGFADFYVPKWGVEIKGCKLFMKDGKRWINLPSESFKKDGETMYSPSIKFRDKKHMDIFNEQAKTAIDAYCEAKVNKKE